MPYCENCGTAISGVAVACPNCGHPTGRSGGLAQGRRRTEGTAIASLILGIAGFVICPIVTSVLAIIFGNQAQRKIAEDPSLEGEGLAKAGVVLGWVALGIAAFGILVVVIAAAAG